MWNRVSDVSIDQRLGNCMNLYDTSSMSLYLESSLLHFFDLHISRCDATFVDCKVAEVDVPVPKLTGIDNDVADLKSLETLGVAADEKSTATSSLPSTAPPPRQLKHVPTGPALCVTV